MSHRVRPRTVVAVVAASSPLLFPALGLAASPREPRASAHAPPSLVWSLPFVLLLLSIAVLPLHPRARHWWEKNRSKLLLSIALSAVVLLYYGLRAHGYHGADRGLPSVVAVAEHAILREFVPFIVLLFCLYVIAGGVQLRGHLRALPSVNTGFLAAGALLASFIGTTGASMVLIRPLLQTNRDRRHVRHTVVFFIFLVSNIGGCLLPLGDPPLFLGYLRGVPFFWTLHLAAPWAFSVSVLLAVYYAWDRRARRAEPASAREQETRHVSRPRIHGAINVLWLLGVILTVALIIPGQALPGTDLVVRDYVREALMIALTAASLATTPRGLRKETEFGYAAIVEVACLFLGIFLTMQAPIEILQSRGAELHLTTPAHFFWTTGALSSVLDNAPTYVVLLEVAKSLTPLEGAATVQLFDGAIRADLLTAISLGAVFMGATTYVGNGPNFMVKAIAEQHGVKMPGVFGYMAYSAGVLIPLFAVVTWLFFG